VERAEDVPFVEVLGFLSVVRFEEEPFVADLEFFPPSVEESSLLGP
jgi:hypothetical protein